MDPAYQYAGGLHISFTACRRSLTLGRWATTGLAIFISAALVWSLLAGIYVCFHDQLLASMMSRQADMQYAYEDQVATLRTELEHQTSRNLGDRQMIDTALQDLTARSIHLEVRAATLDRLMTDEASVITHYRRTSPASDQMISGVPQSPRNASRLNDMGEGSGSVPQPGPVMLRLGGADGGHASLELDELSISLARIEARQLETARRLREPLLRASHRFATALANTGLSHRVAIERPLGVGGPFVPLPDGADRDTFNMDIAKAQTALDQHRQLLALVDRVPLREPLNGQIEISSTFGARVDPFLGRPALHTGIDLRGNGSDAVLATAAGMVTIAGPNGGYGNMVEIDHGAGLVTRYAHLSAIAVVPNQRIAAGAVVGRVGSSGRATGPHLHYETRIDGEPVDPATFLTAGAQLSGN